MVWCPELEREISDGQGSLDFQLFAYLTSGQAGCLRGAGAAGGRILARGLPLQTYEQRQAERVVVIELDSIESARKMQDGADYQAALAALAGGAERDIRLIETV